MPGLQDTFLVAGITEQAIQLLVAADATEAADLSTILTGRLLYMQETKESGQAEIQRIVETVRQMLAKAGSTEKELHETLLDILRCLPARTGDEIAFVRQLAENTTDQEQHEALLVALSRTRPDKDALPVLQAATASLDAQVAKAAQAALDWELAQQQKESGMGRPRQKR